MKGTHVFVPLVERLKAQGLDVELMFFHDVPSREIRFYQAQADIVLDSSRSAGSARTAASR